MWEYITKHFIKPFKRRRLNLGESVESLSPQAVQEIVDNYQVAKSLEIERQRLKLVLETMQDAVISYTSEGVIEEWNSGAEALFDYSFEEARGRRINMLFQEDQFSAVATQKTFPMVPKEITAQRKNGTTFPAEITVSYFEFDDKKYLTGIIRDISQRKQDEVVLLEAKNSAEEASQAKSRFLANISHEVRTPLTVISGYADLLKKRKNANAGETSHLVESIRKNCGLLQNIISDLLDLSRIEAGKVNIQTEMFELSDLLEDLEDTYQLFATERGISMKFNFEFQRPLWVKTDPTRLKQVVGNLLSNALKFTPAGGNVWLRTRVEMNRDQTYTIKIQVEDNGSGIPYSKVSVLFQPFSQANEKVSARLGGVGLGLALSKRLCEFLGGELKLVRTQESRGSLFEAVIQADRVSDVEVTERLKVTEGELDEIPSALEGVKILVVEDTEEILYLISDVLKDAGAQVLCASNGEEALNLFEDTRQNVDFVLLDIRMPGLNGFQTREKLVELGCEVPILALTAHAMREEVKEILSVGFSGYLSKPLDPILLIRTIRLFLNRRKSGIPPTLKVPSALSSSVV